MRIFVALVLPDTLRGVIAEAVEELESARRDLKWVDEENLHITLAFLGELDGRGTELASRIARSVVEDPSRGPFSLGVEGLLTFPPRRAPRVIAAAVVAGNRDATGLAGALEDALETADYPFRERERRAFAPHITLARARGSAAAFSEEERRTRLKGSGLVTTVAVYESRLEPSGPRYIPIEEFRLGGGLSGRGN